MIRPISIRTLAGLGSAEGRALLVSGGGPPLMRGGGDTTFICPKCRAVLAEGVGKDRIWDIAVECPECHGLSEFPRLPDGAQATGFVYVPIGRYVLERTLETRGALIIGEGVVRGGPRLTFTFET